MKPPKALWIGIGLGALAYLVCMGIALASGVQVITPVVAVHPTKTRPLLPPKTGPVAESPTEVFTRQALELVDEKGTPDAIAFVQKRLTEDPTLARSCHGVMHEIGHETLEHHTYQEALSFDTKVCGSGYLHGIVERAFSKEPDPATALAKFCTSRDGRCVHGLGHGVLLHTEGDISEAIPLCSLLTRESRSYCAEGLFMEHFGKDSTGNLKLTEDDTHLLDACHGLRSPYADACYFYGPTSYLGRHTDDFTGALTWCRALGGGSNCIRGVGSRAMKYHIDEPSYSWKLCAGLSNSEKGICTDGAIGYLLVHTESFQPAKDFCATLTGDDRSLCDAAILKRRHWFD